MTHQQGRSSLVCRDWEDLSVVYRHREDLLSCKDEFRLESFLQTQLGEEHDQLWLHGLSSGVCRITMPHNNILPWACCCLVDWGLSSSYCTPPSGKMDGLATVYVQLYILRQQNNSLFFQFWPCAFAADGRGWVSQSWADRHKSYNWKISEMKILQLKEVRGKTEYFQKNHLASVLSK